MAVRLPGINIQQPWSQLLLDGEKKVETRTYPLPERYCNRPMWLVETPGPDRTKRAMVVGVIVFAGSKEYLSRRFFRDDFDQHLVPEDHPLFGYRAERRKFGWMVSAKMRVDAFDPGVRRGIIYTSPFPATTSAVKIRDVERMIR